MLFNSYLFVFVFLPVCLAGYYLAAYKLNGKAAKLWLTVMSLWFYACFGWKYLVLLILSMGINYAVAAGLLRTHRHWLLVFGTGINLVFLGCCKYLGFFLENISALGIAPGGTQLSRLSVLLPVGISFYTFQQISFLTDIYRGETETCSLQDYLLYITYFPKLVEGPIVRCEELMVQFKEIGKVRPQGEWFVRGTVLFVLGMLKKVILADTFGGAVDYGYSNLELMHGTDALLLVLFYSLQLYFDFSGYCDMTRGISRMFGIELPVNFESPYQACNIIDFWKRWHITLNRFFTRYVYIPLGGSREGKVKMYRNLLIVFLLSGIWHGAGWNFILWGMMHGLLYVLTRMYQNRTVGKTGKTTHLSRVGHMTGTVFTFLYVSMAWVYFRAESVAQGNELLAKLFQNDFVRVNRNLAGYFNRDEFWYMLKVLGVDGWEYGHYVLMVVMTAASLILVFFRKNAAWTAERMKTGVWNALLFAGLFLWCVLTFSNVTTFLYFNF